MNIHEYQAKKILASFNVPTPNGEVAFNEEQAYKIAQNLNTPIIVVKAQIHAGGRGKAGGVKLAKSKEEAKDFAKSMLGMTLKTHQTGPEGQLVRRVYLEEGSDIAKEYYLGIVVDRDSSKVTFMASTEGGVEIEEVASEHPEKILKVSIDPASGIQPFHGRKLAYGLGFKGDEVKKFVQFTSSLYEAFVKTDASQLEINPLVLTKSNDFIALDAKFNFDDNALYKHPDIVELRDEEEEEPLEKRALEAGLSYVKMDGNIGCMVNGAGLAMATMDIIKLYGGEPANFLDVGGGAGKEKVTEAFKIILSDQNVKGILVNIFGGIMRCDIIAEGVIAAAKEVGLSVPLVVRLAGTNFELGKKILDNSGLKIVSADDLADAAEKIVKAIS
ncbi:MAG: ADP-forming succinate--CoA ligase subunit beta [Alphaproteobacteria bacterium]